MDLCSSRKDPIQRRKRMAGVDWLTPAERRAKNLGLATAAKMVC
jgi:hypothetical protein